MENIENQNNEGSMPTLPLDTTKNKSYKKRIIASSIFLFLSLVCSCISLYLFVEPLLEAQDLSLLAGLLLSIYFGIPCCIAGTILGLVALIIALTMRHYNKWSKKLLIILSTLSIIINVFFIIFVVFIVPALNK